MQSARSFSASNFRFCIPMPPASPPSIDFFSVFEMLSDILSEIGRFSIYPILDVLRPYTNFISLLLVVAIVYAYVRLNQLRVEDAVRFNALAAQAKTEGSTTHVYKNEKWMRVEKHIESENPSDWRLAVLECDIILEEMVEVMGYRGENLGERLKQVERSDFNTIDQAWEGHKIRNTIAHEGSDFVLSHHEAKRVVGLYKQVFGEFKFI